MTPLAFGRENHHQGTTEGGSREWRVCLAPTSWKDDQLLHSFKRREATWPSRGSQSLRDRWVWVDQVQDWV